VQQSTIHNWETDKTEPNNTYLQRIASYFGVSVDYLLGASSKDYGYIPPLEPFSVYIPPMLRGAEIIYHEREEEYFTQDEIEILNSVAQALVARRKQKEAEEQKIIP